MYIHQRLDEVDSTNTYAKTHFREFPDGSVISARRQTAGRGRLGRKWLSGNDLDITASFLFRKLPQPFYAGVITGVAAIEMLQEELPELSPYLKWPNDIYIGYEKLSGMLSEAVWEKGQMQCVICGIGLNVNTSSEALAGAGQPAVSLFSLTQKQFDVDFLIERLAKIVNRYYIICQQYPQEVFELWRKYNRLAGHEIEVVDPAGTVMRGIFRDIAPGGEMIFVHEGRELLFSCGDVKIIAQSVKF